MNLVIVEIEKLETLFLIKIRGGTARLRVEEGRCSRIDRSERLCQHCEPQEVYRRQ